MRIVLFEPRQLPVGIVRWYGPRPRLTVIIKATFAFPREMDGVLTLADEQEPLSTGVAIAGGGGSVDLSYPNDFVPLKAAVDVLITGSAHTAPPADRIDAAVRIGAWSRAFTVRAGSAAESIPLVAPYLWSLEGGDDAAVGARRVATPTLDAIHAGDFDYAHFNAAPRPQRLPDLATDATIELFALSPRAPTRALRLPGLRPTLIVERDDSSVEQFEPALDTLWIDTDGERCVLVFREDFLVDSTGAPDVDRILVAFAERAIDHEELLPLLPRIAPRFGIEPPILRADAVDEDEADELTMARYATWEEAPEPVMPFDRYAQISAELAEKREPREATLRRHDLDDDTWTLEERAWLGELARGAVMTDGAATDFGERYLRAQDAAAAPGEETQTIADYAELTAVIEQATDPTRVLARRGLTMGAYQRLDRRWTRAMRADPELAATFERHLAAARGRPTSEPADEEAGA